MDYHPELVSLYDFTYKHGLSPGATAKALKHHDIEVFDVPGSRHIRLEDATKLIDLEARIVDGEESA